MDFSADISIAAAALSAGLAAVAAFKARRSLTRWIFVLGLVCLSAEVLCDGWRSPASGPGFAGWQAWKLIVGAFGPGLWVLFSLRYARGNTDRHLPRWLPMLVAIVVLPPGFAWFYREQLILKISQNPITQQWIIGLRWPAAVLYVIRMLAALVVLINLERTFRASIGTMRWRIKYLVLGLAVVFIVRIYTSSQVLLFHGEDQRWCVMEATALLLGSLLIIRALPRAGVFDLEVYPSHEVLRHSLTLSVAGLYLLIIGLGAKAVAFFGGDASFSLKAFIVLISLVLLALVLQSDHVRFFSRRFISRHFQRPIYDYRSVWRNFSEGTAACVDQSDLARALVRLFAETFQALSVNLWLVNEKTERLALTASTALFGAVSWDLIPTRREAIQIIRGLADAKEPVDFDRAEGDWAVALRRCNPGEFPKGGRRICLALKGSGELLGVITLGDRVGGAPFSDQDIEMLKCAGNHSATALLNAGLLEKSLQTKELEAFQTMAAFFVHDLKNSAFTLNLMLQNLPVHFDDPAFREDALRGIGKTVEHINKLVSRLNLLRQGFRIVPVPTSLENVIARVVEECGSKPGVTISIKQGPPMSLGLDPEQIGKVFTNLVLNAMDAIEAKGEICISLQSEGSWAVVAVSDTGCGMSDEFREKSLFRPFQTTKKNGLGIGMFQSKMIVEAHRGTIAVQSVPGQGTTFKVRLPLTTNSLTPWPNRTTSR
jgi:putative PEP-CTERM system histidine kinase